MTTEHRETTPALRRILTALRKGEAARPLDQGLVQPAPSVVDAILADAQAHAPNRYGHHDGPTLDLDPAHYPEASAEHLAAAAGPATETAGERVARELGTLATHRMLYGESGEHPGGLLVGAKTYDQVQADSATMGQDLAPFLHNQGVMLSEDQLVALATPAAERTVDQDLALDQVREEAKAWIEQADDTTAGDRELMRQLDEEEAGRARREAVARHCRLGAMCVCLRRRLDPDPRAAAGINECAEAVASLTREAIDQATAMEADEDARRQARIEERRSLVRLNAEGWTARLQYGVWTVKDENGRTACAFPGETSSRDLVPMVAGFRLGYSAGERIGHQSGKAEVRDAIRLALGFSRSPR